MSRCVQNKTHSEEITTNTEIMPRLRMLLQTNGNKTTESQYTEYMFIGELRCTTGLGAFSGHFLAQHSQRALPNKVTHYDKHSKISKMVLKKKIYHWRVFSLKDRTKSGT